MKLRSLLLTAALFVTAGVTFAGSTDFADYSWNNKKNWKKIDVKLTKFQTQTGFQYSVYDVDAYNSIIEKAVADGVEFKNNNQKMDYAIAQLKKENKIWDLKDPGKNNSKVTVISLPAGSEVKNFGVIGEQKVLSVPNVSNNFHFYTTSNTPANTVFYGNPGHGNGNEKSAQVSFGQPLPAPVVTLLIALAFGAGLVMYRNRKQVKA